MAASKQSGTGTSDLDAIRKMIAEQQDGGRKPVELSAAMPMQATPTFEDLASLQRPKPAPATPEVKQPGAKMAPGSKTRKRFGLFAPEPGPGVGMGMASGTMGMPGRGGMR